MPFLLLPSIAVFDTSSRDFDDTATCIIAFNCICIVFIFISISLEISLHILEKWLRDNHKKFLFEVFERVKRELIILVFTSFLLTFGESYMIKICIPANIANIMMPFYNPYKMKYYKNRFLSAAATGYSCKEGHIPLVSANALHQLHILLFFSAVFLVIYSAIIMFLGRLKMGSTIKKPKKKRRLKLRKSSVRT